MKEVKLWAVGSISRDDIRTPLEYKQNVLGGSLPYSTIAASFFQKTGAVGLVGTDFSISFSRRWASFKLDLSGVKKAEGKTFHWACEYEDNMISRKTLATDLGVFANFKPELPESYRDVKFVLLGNIDPKLQLSVLDQARDVEFVTVDTMNYWIQNAKEDLRKVIRRATMLTVNDEEARLLTGQRNLLEAAAELIKMGPRYVLIKKGEHGALLFSQDDIFIVPAYPVRRLVDPTGAGDSYAGAFMGCLSRATDTKEKTVRTALLHASAVASFCVEEFSIDRFTRLSLPDIKSRVSDLKQMIKV